MADHISLLVVDDNEDNRDMLSRRLRRQGYNVEMAEDGNRALDMIAAAKYDLILLDIMMPGISGIEVLKTVRERHSVADLPVIMATAKDHSEDIVYALKLGANDYVTKPIDFPVVMARIQTQLSLKRLSELKDEFLRMASHDLKNPLTVILGSVKVVQRLVPPGTAMTEDSYDLLSRMSKRATEMQRMIEEFLDFEAMQDGRLSLLLTEFQLNDVARECVEANLDYAKGKEIALNLKLDSTLPPISADVARIKQVIQNLIGNAVKFGPKGSETQVRIFGNHGFQLFEVSDRGPGIKEEDMKKLFQKYAKLSNKPTGGEKSSGLGLAICKQFIDLHGGEIGARNNPDGGSTFWFRLPRTRSKSE
jgi:signal transduction histidine kinase